MKRFFLLFMSVLLALSLFSACKGEEGTSPEPELTPAEKLLARYSEIANEHSALASLVAEKSDMQLTGKYSRLAIDLTDIATAITKAGEGISDEEASKHDAELTKCEEALSEIKELLEK